MLKKSPAAVKGQRWTNERHELTERLLESWYLVVSCMGLAESVSFSEISGFIIPIPKVPGMMVP